ncbi:MAG: thioredoxin domain-containing protein [Gracilimonas sp.]
MSRRVILWSSLAISMVLIVLLIVWQVGNTEPQVQESRGQSSVFEVTENDWKKGNPEADIVVIKYSDFQCPACYSYAAMDHQLSQELGDKVLFVYRHFPLQSFQYSRMAARYAEAAGRQGKFWEMHDLIYNNQQNWRSGNAILVFRQLAELLDLDMQQMDKDILDPKIESRINMHYGQGQQIGVRGVPAIFINGKQFPYTQSIDEYRNQILSFQ